MSVKYSRVDEVPAKLTREEMVITVPNFMREIESLNKQLGVKKTITARFIRQVFTEIGLNYDETFDPSRQLNASKYECISFTTLEDVSKIIVSIAEAECPFLIEKAIESQIRSRPSRIKHIYYVAPDYKYSIVFTRNSVAQDLPSNTKSKKTTSQEE